MSDWKLVPVEPTDEMLVAGQRVLSSSADAVYRAMIADAPDLTELRALVEKMRKSSEYSLQHGHHAAGKEAEHWADELEALIELMDRQ